MGYKKQVKGQAYRKAVAKTLALAMCVTALPQTGGNVHVYAAEGAWDFSEGTQGWDISDWSDKDITSGLKVSNASDGRLKFDLDFTGKAENGWLQAGIGQTDLTGVSFEGKDKISLDFYYKNDAKTTGELTIKAVAQVEAANGTDWKDVIEDGADCVDVTNNDSLPSEDAGDGWTKKSLSFKLDQSKMDTKKATRLLFIVVGRNTDYKGSVYFDNILVTVTSDEEKGYVNSTVKADTKTRISGTDKVITINGSNYNYADNIKLADDKADAETVALYQYLKAVGESSSVIYGHMEDTVLKAGDASLSYSDTEDMTGSISAVDGLDCGDLFKGFAEKFASRYPEEAKALGIKGNGTTEDDIKAAAAFSNKSVEAGAIMTLSAHMPNFAYAEKKANADSIEKTYDKFDYSAANYGELKGDCMNNILPGGRFNEAYTAYLDLIAEYASQVKGTILFRPFHENTGSWFWWGSAFCSPDTYKNVFKYTVGYLCDEKNIHNILYLYGPGSEASTEAEYEERYPGDGYVDLVGFDSYDDNPSAGEGYTFQSNLRNTIKLTDTFAKKHNKLFAVTETGIRNGNNALLVKDNARKDWYNEILDIVTDNGFNCCYFMLWSNYSSQGSYYTPFVTKKNSDGSLNGHEMLDSFIRFYNNEKSIFASDQKDIMSGFESITKPQIAAKELDGYITLPVSGSRINNPAEVTAKLNMETDKEVSVRISGNGNNVNLETKKDAAGKVYTASITKENLDVVGETLQGKIGLYADNVLLQEINVIFNVEEKVMTKEQVDDFETYGGLTSLLIDKWAKNNDSGCTIDVSLVKEPCGEGEYALKFAYDETKTGWGGVTISKEADWSEYNALRFWVKPDGKNQKTVVQINSGSGSYEAYLNLYEEYANSKEPLLVTLPFSEFIDKNGTSAPLGGEALKSISQFGLWVNAIGDSDSFANGETMVSGELYYDDIRAVSIDTDKPVFQKAGETPADNTDTETGSVYHTNVSDFSSQNPARIVIPESYLSDAKSKNIKSIVLSIEKAVVDAVKENKGSELVIEAKVPDDKDISVGKVLLTKESVSSAAASGKNLVIKIISNVQAETYNVTIPSGQLGKIDRDIDVTVKNNKISGIKGDKGKNIKSILSASGVKTADSYVVSVAANNTNAGIKVTAPVISSAKKGDNVYVYCYNNKTGKLDEIANSKRKVLSGRKLTFESYSGNDYVITNKELSGKNVVTLLGSTKVKAGKVSIKKGGETKINVVLPAGLVSKTSLKKNVPYGKQAVVIQYKSSDTKVAKVSKDGTVKASGTGKTVITVKIKLADGKVKTVKKKITIK